MIFVGRDEHAVVPHTYFGNINFIKTIKLYVVTCTIISEWIKGKSRDTNLMYP